MVKAKAARISLVLFVAVVFFTTTGMAQSWLKGYQFGAETVTVPYSVADVEYGKTLKLRIDSDRDKVRADKKLASTMFGPYHWIGDTYYFGTFTTAVVVIKTADGNIMINWPYGGDYGWGDKDVSEATIANMENAGLYLKDLKYYLSTESHGDHNGGVAEVIAKSHAKLIVMEGDENAMENQKDIGYPQPKVTQIIHNGFQLKFGGKTLTAYHTKGHTPGATTWTWQEKANGTTYNVGEMCCWEMPANVVTNPTVTTAELQQTWKILKSLPIDIPIPQHPWQFGWPAKKARLDSGEEPLSVLVDPQAYRGWVTVYEKIFEDNLADQLKNGPPPPKKGGPGTPPGQ